MFETLMIANRGEIACRVMRTARRMGIRTVAVYSEADRGALHVEMADQAYPIGPAAAAESYLDIEAVIRAARRAGAGAIHPGYGFLAENPDFAEACASAGIVFVGPPAAAIRAMGSKIEAKRVMDEAGVLLVPGSGAADRGYKALAAAAARLGYPVLVKASAGGGGKGMRRVEAAGELEAALAAARREAKAAFGDGRLMIEKALDRPRHVEVQVFCDAHGGAVHLFERDCSVQRRHQKVIEEAPAPGMTARRRERMGAAAIAAAKAIGYIGAGTVEFLVDRRGRFYFIEMNTRLQVEHAVTEMVTGVDMVEWQLRVAAGERLPRRQDQLSIDGHAIEARLYAEDPARGFLPSAGPIERLRWPAQGKHLRLDTGVREGDAVSVHYDPMIAKLIAWDADRPAALRRLGAALGATRLIGPATNLGLLAAVVAHPAFAAGRVDTGFIERHRARLAPAAGPAPGAVLALACLALMLDRDRQAAEAARRSDDPYSPWHRGDGWRLDGHVAQSLILIDDGREVTAEVRHQPGGYRIGLGDAMFAARGRLDPAGELIADLDGTPHQAMVLRRGGELVVSIGGRQYGLGLRDRLAVAGAAEVPSGALTAPMPGRVVAVLVAAGEPVKKGAPLMLLEAMKMEHAITAPMAGTVEAVHYAPGDQVEEGAVLLSIGAGTGD